MNKFTEVYSKAKDVVEKQQFETKWEKFLKTDCKAKTLFGEKGFGTAAADAPARVRQHIRDLTRSTKKNSGEVIYAAAQGGKPGVSLLERAATIKMIRHTHRIHKKGGQDVWVYSPPKAYAEWIFDALGGTVATAKARLAKEEELFTREQMKWMSSALAIALKISEDTRAKLGTAKSVTTAVSKAKAKGGSANLTQKELLSSSATEAKITRWFAPPEDKMGDAITTLNEGFKKIAVACAAATLVFTDYPNWRAQRNKYFGGAIAGGEGGGFPVVYLEGAFTRLTGNSGKIWLCAETIIHELSHYELRTKDVYYDSDGLKPNDANFPYEKTIVNADTWGYFAIDLAGYLSKRDLANAYK